MSRASRAFELLHPKVQRWLWQQGWPELKDIQERAIAPILAARDDVVIAAPTAGGKTEAAFLPILSRLAEDSSGSVRVLYVSPLKALINDQFDRLERLCDQLDVEVRRWHGDVAATQKRKVLDKPAGILIITPESLEAISIIHGPRLAQLFAKLDFVVVDELHAFIGSERGAQLRSLLHRLELAIRRVVPRIALSATLGDMDLACDYLRPGAGPRVLRIVSSGTGGELRLQVRGYRQPAVSRTIRDGQAEEFEQPRKIEEESSADEMAITAHLFEKLRGGHHLIFTNTRSAVERTADLLRRLSDQQGLPVEFWPHHGSLSKELREEAEAAIKNPSRPATVIATTTLELGIDVGAIESVAQLGAPATVASLRQRLGRSGRQEGPAVLRIYVREPTIDGRTPPPDTLRPELLRTLAMVELLLGRWCEPPRSGAMHLSTLVQQVLSLIAQHGGVAAAAAWRALCQQGPFSAVDSPMFATLLRSLGRHDLIHQTHSGELVLGLAGERLVNHYEFYAAFQSAEEYRLTCRGKNLGTLPTSRPLFVGLFLIFGARRWVVVAVDDERKIVDLEPARGGRVPSFAGASVAAVDARVRQKMLEIYQGCGAPAYLDRGGRDLLTEARDHFARYRLSEQSFVTWGDDTFLFTWAGDDAVHTLVIWLSRLGLEVTLADHVLIFRKQPAAELARLFEGLVSQAPPSHLDLAADVVNKRTEKFHPYLDDPLLEAEIASSRLDVTGAAAVLERSVAADRGG